MTNHVEYWRLGEGWLYKRTQPGGGCTFGPLTISAHWYHPRDALNRRGKREAVSPGYGGERAEESCHWLQSLRVTISTLALWV